MLMADRSKIWLASCVNHILEAVVSSSIVARYGLSLWK